MARAHRTRIAHLSADVTYLTTVRHDEVDGSVMLGRGRAPRGAVVLSRGRLELFRGAEHGCDVDWRARWFCDRGLWFAARRCVCRVWLARVLAAGAVLAEVVSRSGSDPGVGGRVEERVARVNRGIRASETLAHGWAPVLCLLLVLVGFGPQGCEFGLGCGDGRRVCCRKTGLALRSGSWRRWPVTECDCLLVERVDFHPERVLVERVNVSGRSCEGRLCRLARMKLLRDGLALKLVVAVRERVRDLSPEFDEAFFRGPASHVGIGDLFADAVNVVRGTRRNCDRFA